MIHFREIIDKTKIIENDIKDEFSSPVINNKDIEQAETSERF